MTSSTSSPPKPGSASVIAAALLLAAIVAACLAAPLYARYVSQSDPFRSNVDGQITIAGHPTDLLAENTAGLGLGVTPLGPTWRAAYFLGADGQGRDVAARLLYGGRISLLIATAATGICVVIATLVGTLAGYAGGPLDAGLAWLLDLLWAFPTYLLAISLSIVLLSSAAASSLLLPIGILAAVYIPYVARPVRQQVIALRQTEFVLAAVATGASPRHILHHHLLPHLATTLLLLTPIVMAMTLLTEAALSVLSIGVQAPAASWGTLIGDGQTLIYTRPLVALAPGVAVLATVLCLNLLAERLRAALDPRN